MNEKIVQILIEALENIYCDTCAFGESQQRCDECNRRQMNWQPSNKFCSEVAEKICKKMQNKSPTTGGE